MIEEENKYKNLIDDLKNLPKVEAPKNFETELLRKINSSEAAKEISFWEKLLSPGKLVPATAAIVSAVIIFFVVDINSEEMEDPLNLEPRLREDLAIVEAMNVTPVELQKKSSSKEVSKTNSDKSTREKEINIPEPMPNNGEKKSEMKSSAIEKSFADEIEFGKSDSDGYYSDDMKSLGESIAPSPVTTATSEISKDNLNFMQRNLSVEEKIEVQQLKMKVQTGKSVKTDQNSRKLP